jgi:hypothetical protein
MFTVKIPKVGIVRAASIEALAEAAWKAVHGGNSQREYYGCSDVGTGWPVKDGNRLIGTMRYNGRFDPTDLPGHPPKRDWFEDASRRGFTDEAV